VCVTLNHNIWPTRRGHLLRLAMPPRRSSTRLGGRLQGGCVSSTLKTCPTRPGHLLRLAMVRRRSSTRLGSEAVGRVRELNPQDLSNTAWAFATAGRAAPALFDAIMRESAGRVRELNPQNLANTAWAFAVMDHLTSESSLFDQRFAHHCDALAHEFNSLDLRQLHQWRLWYASERACSDALPGPALLARCDAAFRAAEAQPSRLQRDVAKALALQGASVQEEKVLEEGYSLDLVVDCGGEELIAIEVDGPSHFVGREPTGATLLKRRQLRHLGWQLVSVPYWEWAELNHNDTLRQREQRAAYLSALLSDEEG